MFSKYLTFVALPLALGACSGMSANLSSGGLTGGTSPTGVESNTGGSSGQSEETGGSEGEGTGSGGSGGESAGGSFYAPVFANGSLTNKSAMTGDGLSGFYTRPDGTIGEIGIRLSEDGKTVYVSLDGGPETAWSTRTSGNANGGTWTGDAGTLTVGWKGDSNTSALLNGQSAVFGLETPVDSLPGGEVRYNGPWSTNGGNGALNVIIDFGSGALGGGLTGAFAGMGGVDGVVSGTLDGSRINGTIALSSDSFDGSMDFFGALYGSDASRAAGVLGGSFGGETQTGDFSLNRNGN